VPFWKSVRPDLPDGYAHDYVNAEVLLNRSLVRNGRVVLAGGMSYAVLVLPDDVDRLTLPMLRKLRDLVAAGATIVAPRPGAPPSLSGGRAADDEARAIVSTLWGGIDGRGVTEHAYGRGRVFWGRPVAEVLAARSTPPDVRFAEATPDSAPIWIHRRAADVDIYFVANQLARPVDVETSFRVAGRAPELWFPDTGERQPASFRIEAGRTMVPLRLDAHGSVFVVFRRVASTPSRAVAETTRRTLVTLEGPWTVAFPPEQGAPAQARFDSLASWTTSAESGVKYFSGTATYAKPIDVPADWIRSGVRVALDLGAVKEIAEVVLNGQRIGGVLWKAPYVVDLTAMLKQGRNQLEVKVTNLWVNRIVGDAQPSVTRRYTFLGYPQYSGSSPLMPSGLLGPVRLQSLSGGAGTGSVRDRD
jgi:hypothetical protein